MSEYYSIINQQTGKAVNRQGLSGAAVKDGQKATIYAPTGSPDQIFGMKREGEYAALLLNANESFVLNRHTGDNSAIFWGYSKSTKADILTNTETVNGIVRLKLALQPDMYLTAAGEQDGAPLAWLPKANNPLQYWRFDKAAATAAPAAGKQLAIQKLCQQSFTSYSTYFRNHACLATCVLAIAQYYGHNITMQTLVNGGLVRSDSAYVNGTGKYFAWTISQAGAAEATYCKAIAAAIDTGNPVVVKITKGGTDHFVVACGYTSATAGGITILDPTDGVYRSLKSAFTKHNKTFVHIRVCRG